ncbi:Uma2 family endonuclease [Jiangella aurantiaca]|uniref:Uma2 family endonuclease n=1 Tax=Jiangella aurantiaca TaxID=2530373 RepID=A0A4R5ALT4_9ACTN|nr:Uma2 family endonuclease [Jiangella aurantiaca]TDD72004.1 Uma2 family endonuclease [Jiangella aurantiaca]
MTVTADREVSWDELLHAWLSIDTPEGWRAEIVDGEMVVAPRPGVPHNVILDVVNKALIRRCPDTFGVFQTLGVTVPTARGAYVPDLCVILLDRLPRDAEYVPAELLLLAVEVTSMRNADHDRKAKKWGYAHAGVPLYLLIDRFDDDGPTVSLFSSPVDGAYSETSTVRFGKAITLPEPFGLEISTSAF